MRQEDVGKMRDITCDRGDKDTVQVEIDHNRGVVYVHVRGATVFRLCRAGKIEVETHGEGISKGSA